MCQSSSNYDGPGAIDVRKLRPVKTSTRLEAEVRRLINSCLEKTRDTMGEDDFFYIGRQFKRKLKAVSASRIPWVRQLAEEMAILHEIYRAHIEGEVHLDDDVIATIGVALLYFVDPYDIIPDHVPGKGYIDDAYVFNRCLRQLNKCAPQYIAD